MQYVYYATVPESYYLINLHKIHFLNDTPITLLLKNLVFIVRIVNHKFLIWHILKFDNIYDDFLLVIVRNG